MSGRLVLVGLLALTACAHAPGAGGAMGEATLPLQGRFPSDCAEPLGVSDADYVLSYEDRQNVALLDAACVAWAREASSGGVCAAGELARVRQLRSSALVEARVAASARRQGDLPAAFSSSRRLRALREAAAEADDCGAAELLSLRD